MYLIVIDTEKCKACGECVKICPGEIYKVEGGRLVVGDSADCSGCQSCVSVCENQAVTVSDI